MKWTWDKNDAEINNWASDGITFTPETRIYLRLANKEDSRRRKISVLIKSGNHEFSYRFGPKLDKKMTGNSAAVAAITRLTIKPGTKPGYAIMEVWFDSHFYRSTPLPLVRLAFCMLQKTESRAAATASARD